MAAAGLETVPAISPSPQLDFSGLRPPAPARPGAYGPSAYSRPAMSAAPGGSPSGSNNGARQHGPSRSKSATAPEPVIGHMGRLVSDDRSVAMFAGSTTGVHFVSQAEQQVQLLQIHGDMFPRSAYGLHLHDLWGSIPPNDRSTPDDDELIRAAVARIPPDATDVIGATIDRWTPIYPIVHKPTAMDGVRDLIDDVSERSPASTSPRRAGPNAVIVLYQALALLALGSVGRPMGRWCPRAGDNHRRCHFLCLSEVYYSLSTAVLDKVLERPCLQTLQGLEVIQIYLQISSRYTIASHVGGIATRMAQSLGLHRHSHRFKFDPLETELRRRAWWCQFSLDTFSSAYHGLPRLIRDQDVDTDLPTSTDHDLLSRSHVGFPLPGERSQVDSALCLFKLARIMAETLENLYTTTRRRGGVDKIRRLDAELDMWQRGLPEDLQLPAQTAAAADGRGGDGSHRGGSGGGGRGGGGGQQGADVTMMEGACEGPSEGHSGAGVNSSFAATFLRVGLCIARIHVHRPALSFTNPDPQSTESLRTCVAASAELTRIISSGLEDFVHESSRPHVVYASTTAGNDPFPYPGNLLVMLLYPNGAHMLWQAGLTILYSRWKRARPSAADQQTRLRDGGTTDDDTLADAEGQELVRRCATSLRRLRDVTRETSVKDVSTGEDQLAQCADVLDLLREKTWGVPTEGLSSDEEPYAEAAPAPAPAPAPAGPGPGPVPGSRSKEEISGIGATSRSPAAPDNAMPPASGAWDQQQISWNVWDWPMESALELANSMDAAPLDLFLEGGQWFQ